ncbi:hypothetical protein N7540_007880 [Penicillium herquei]|nr:hypothetical protein N7540_007880 [Penicillium herquei]
MELLQIRSRITCIQAVTSVEDEGCVEKFKTSVLRHAHYIKVIFTYADAKNKRDGKDASSVENC